MVVLYVACQTPKINNLCCTLKNSSYHLAVTKHIILTEEHVTYNITEVLFGFKKFLHFERIFRTMRARQTPNIDNL